MNKLNENESSYLFNINRELDYSISNSDSIDQRVLTVCLQAEKKYLENQKTVREIENMRKSESRLNKSNSTNTISPRSKNINNRPNRMSYDDKFYYIPETYNYEDNSQIPLQKKQYFEHVNKSVNFHKNDSNMRSTFQTDRYKSIENFNQMKSSQTQTFDDNGENYKLLHDKLKINHRELKSGNKCIACELKKK